MRFSICVDVYRELFYMLSRNYNSSFIYCYITINTSAIVRHTETHYNNDYKRELTVFCIRDSSNSTYMFSTPFESSPPLLSAYAKPLLSTRPSRLTGSMAINPDLLFILYRSFAGQGVRLWHCRGYITGPKRTRETACRATGLDGTWIKFWDLSRQ